MQRSTSVLIPCLLALAVTKGETSYQLDPDTGITLPQRFDAEILYEVPKSQGSWVAMAFDEFKLLKRLNYGYEHSAHSIIETADGKGLYLVSGNFTRTPEGTTSLQPRVWQEDTLLSPLPDPMGHAVGLKAPGGWICRISPDGSDWNMMPPGMIAAMNADELRDLIAYLVSGGNPEHEAFKKP